MCWDVLPWWGDCLWNSSPQSGMSYHSGMFPAMQCPTMSGPGHGVIPIKAGAAGLSNPRLLHLTSEVALWDQGAPVSSAGICILPGKEGKEWSPLCLFTVLLTPKPHWSIHKNHLSMWIHWWLGGCWGILPTLGILGAPCLGAHYLKALIELKKSSG